MFYACNAQGGRAAMRYSIDAPLAMAYVPMQVWRNLYSARDALAQGTLFSELNDMDIDPEGTTGGSSIDTYPNIRIFNFGVNITF